MALSILSRLREYVGDRRRTPRRGARFGAAVPAEVAPLDKGAGPDERFGPSVAGTTRDLGVSGLTLLVAGVRAGGRYLTDNDCHLGVALELPSGRVFLLARVVRFEQPPAPGGKYLLGLRILGARAGDRAAYCEFLEGLTPAERRAGEHAGARTELSELAAGGQAWPGGTEAASVEGLRAAFENFIGSGAPPRRT